MHKVLYVMCTILYFCICNVYVVLVYTMCTMCDHVCEVYSVYMVCSFLKHIIIGVMYSICIKYVK